MEQRGLKVLTHASAFFAPFLVPVAIFIVGVLIKDEEVQKTAIQAVLFQLVMSALLIVSALLILAIIGIPMVIGFAIMWIVVPIIAIVKSLNGEDYNYPIVGKWYV